MKELKKYRYEYGDWNGFGQRVRATRKSLGLTVENLAEMIDRTENFINRVEKGEKSCSIHTIHQISKSLRVSTDVLLYGEIMKEKEYSDKEIVQNIINKCDEQELVVIKQLILAVFPKFEDIINKM